MARLKELFNKLNKLVNLVYHAAIITLIFIVLLVCINIFSRYALHYPLNWVPGVVTLLTDWAVFLMAGVYIYRKQGIVIPYFHERFFPHHLQQITNTIVTLLIAAFTAIAAWTCFMNLQTGNYLTSLCTLPIHYYWYTMPFFIGMLIGLTGAVKQFFTGETCTD